MLPLGELLLLSNETVDAVLAAQMIERHENVFTFVQGANATAGSIAELEGHIKALRSGMQEDIQDAAVNAAMREADKHGTVVRDHSERGLRSVGIIKKPKQKSDK